MSRWSVHAVAFFVNKLTTLFSRERKIHVTVFRVHTLKRVLTNNSQTERERGGEGEGEGGRGREREGEYMNEMEGNMNNCVPYKWVHTYLV